MAWPKLLGPDIIGGGLGAVVHGDGGRYRNDEGDGEAGFGARGFQPRGPLPNGGNGGCCPDIFHSLLADRSQIFFIDITFDFIYLFQ